MSDKVVTQKKDMDVKPVFLESGIEVDPVYTGADIRDSDIQNELPGEYPFTRGIHSTMYRKRPLQSGSTQDLQVPKKPMSDSIFLLKMGSPG